MIQKSDSMNAAIAMALITNISRSKAQMMINQVRAAMNIPKPKVLFVSDFCSYYGIPIPQK